MRVLFEVMVKQQHEGQGRSGVVNFSDRCGSCNPVNSPNIHLEEQPTWKVT